MIEELGVVAADLSAIGLAKAELTKQSGPIHRSFRLYVVGYLLLHRYRLAAESGADRLAASE